MVGTPARQGEALCGPAMATLLAGTPPDFEHFPNGCHGTHGYQNPPSPSMKIPLDNYPLVDYADIHLWIYYSRCGGIVKREKDRALSRKGQEA